MDTCSVCNTQVTRGERIKAGTSVYHVKCFVCVNCKNELESFIKTKDGLMCDDCEIKVFSKKCEKCTLPIQSTVVTARGKSFHNDCFTCGGCHKIIKGGFFFNNNEFYCNVCDSNPPPKQQPIPAVQIQQAPIPSTQSHQHKRNSSIGLNNGIEISVPNNSTNIIYVIQGGASSAGGDSSNNSPILSHRNSSDYVNNGGGSGSGGPINTSQTLLSPNINHLNNSGGRLSNDYLASLQDDLYAKQQQQLLQLQQQQIQIQQQLAAQQLEILNKNQSLLDSTTTSPNISNVHNSPPPPPPPPQQQQQQIQSNKPGSTIKITAEISALNINGSSSPPQQSSSPKLEEIEKYIPKINGQTLSELLKHQSFEDILGEVLQKKINVYKELEKDQVEFGDVLATGASGKVYKGKYKGRDVAIKVYSSDNFVFNTEEFDREVTIMSLIDSDHPNFTKFYGANKQNNKRLFHVSELVKSGSLRDLVLGGSPLLYVTQLSIALDIANAMKYLHSIGVIHRDLKSLNVLITENTTAKVIDFGASRNVDHKLKLMTLNIGTSSYMAPELFKGLAYDESCDVYAFGITLWEIFSRLEPYASVNSWSIPVMVTKGERPTIPSDCPSDISKLIKSCWAEKPRKRPTFEEIYHTLKKISNSLTLKKTKK